MTTLANGQYVDETTWSSPNYWPGRPQGVTGVTIHWWGVPEWHQTFNAVADYLSTPRGASSTSAHFVVSDTRVACLVSPTNRAWHALSGNETTVGLELDPNGGAATLENAAQLIAYLEGVFGRSLDIYPHSRWTSTQCPGKYSDRINWLADRANQIRAGLIALPEATEQAGEEITNKTTILEDIMALFESKEEFTTAITEAVQAGIQAEFTPGQEGVKHAGVGYLAVLDATKAADAARAAAVAVHDLLTPGISGVKFQGAVDAKLNDIAAKLPEGGGR